MLHQYSKRDTIRINANDPAEIAAMHYLFPYLSMSAIEKVIKEKRGLRPDVMKCLRKMNN